MSDFTRALTQDRYDVVQFSGHGDSNGIYLEDPDVACSRIVGLAEAAEMIKAALPNLRLAICVSCFSADSIDALGEVAPFVITIKGEADDKDAISFLDLFYRTLLQTGSIERSYDSAAGYFRLRATDGFSPVLSRRSPGKHRSFVRAVLPGLDSVFIDFGEAESDAISLGLSREEFTKLLTRKIRLHQPAFTYERENALIPLGSYFGLFSWTARPDVITCHKIMKLRADVDEDTCLAWMRFLVIYNDRRSERYRGVDQPADPNNAEFLKEAASRLGRNLEEFLNGNEGRMLRKVAPQEFKLCRANAFANFETAEAALQSGDFEAAVIKLELTLSSVHDFIAALMVVLTEGGRGHDLSKENT